MRLSSDEAREYAERSRAKRKATARYNIEGSNVTIEEIASRLGVNCKVASQRLFVARGLDGPVTWAALATDRRKKENKT